jgi:hypothetical protein
MAEARVRSMRIRSRAAGLFAAGYVLTLATFWFAGIVVFAVYEEGLLRLAGLAYFPILLLPVMGYGTVWFWLFALQMVLGAGAMWMYPYEQKNPHHPRRPRVGVPRGRSLARMPRI